MDSDNRLGSSSMWTRQLHLYCLSRFQQCKGEALRSRLDSRLLKGMESHWLSQKGSSSQKGTFKR